MIFIGNIPLLRVDIQIRCFLCPEKSAYSKFNREAGIGERTTSLAVKQSGFDSTVECTAVSAGSTVFTGFYPSHSDESTMKDSLRFESGGLRKDSLSIKIIWALHL